MLRIVSDQRGDATVVRIEGDFDRGAMEATPGAFTRVIEEAGAKVVVDLSDASFLDSGSIVLLLEAHKAAESGGGDFALAACPPLIDKCLSTLGLHDVFAVHDTVDDAIASFGQAED